MTKKQKKCYICGEKLFVVRDFKNYHMKCIWLDKEKGLYNPKVKKKMNYIFKKHNYRGEMLFFDIDKNN